MRVFCLMRVIGRFPGCSLELRAVTYTHRDLFLSTRFAGGSHFSRKSPVGGCTVGSAGILRFSGRLHMYSGLHEGVLASCLYQIVSLCDIHASRY